MKAFSFVKNFVTAKEGMREFQGSFMVKILNLGDRGRE